MPVIRDIRYGFIHCADTWPHQDVGIADFTKWHLARGWRGVGYNYGIRRSGQVEFGRDLDDDGDIWEEIGAHARGYNSRSLGICLAGGKGSNENDRFEDHFTPEQRIALAALMHGIQGALPKIKWLGHNAVAANACPGFQVNRAFLNSMGL